VLLNSNVGSGPHYEASCGLASSACSMWNLSQTTREDWPLALEHDGGLQVSDGSQFTCWYIYIYRTTANYSNPLSFQQPNCFYVIPKLGNNKSKFCSYLRYT
jgi:hypothetical protein